jgi:hypothetical protein
MQNHQKMALILRGPLKREVLDYDVDNQTLLHYIYRNTTIPLPHHFGAKVSRITKPGSRVQNLVVNATPIFWLVKALAMSEA